MNQETLDKELVSAVKYSLEKVKFLVEKGANIRFNDDEPFKDSIFFGQFNIAEWLLNNGSDIHANDDEALRLNSSYKDHAKHAKWLIEHGANIEVKDGKILKLWCSIGDLDMVIYLISKGMNIHLDGEDPLKIASHKGHLDIVKYIIEENSDNTHRGFQTRALLSACKGGQLEIVKYLVSKGFKINMWSNEPIEVASSNDHLEVVRFLVQNGADWNKIFINWNSIKKYKNEQAIVDYTLGPDYPYDKTTKMQQIIDAVNKDPSIINNLHNNPLVKHIPEIQHLLKSDEYGLFERKIMNFDKYIKINKKF